MLNQDGHDGGEKLIEQWSVKSADELAANFRRMARVPFLFRRAQRVKKGATPSEVVYEEDRLKLLHYTSDVPRRFRTPLVFVFALVNRPYILDLKEGKSVVEHFVKRGFDTYLIDWGIPTDSDCHLTLDDYINGYMPKVLDYVRERTNSSQASVLGYCMGGTMSAMFTALHQKMVRNLILLAAGIDFGSPDGLLQLWNDASVFDVDGFVDAYGNAPAEFLQASFQMLKPIANLVQKPINFFERLEDEEFVDDYFAMESWLNDNIPMAGETFRQFVKYLYQQNRLVKGTMPIGKHTVNLESITCPVLNLMAKRDDLVPCSQSAPFNDLVSSTDRRTIEFAAGHIGLAVGSKAQMELWPQVCEWLAAHSDAIERGEEGRPALTI
jgi:poly[(R)-3-hydroxyalkanoate] polymerase subunit PhaC